MGWLYENTGNFEQARDILLGCQKLAEENKFKLSERLSRNHLLEDGGNENSEPTNFAC